MALSAQSERPTLEAWQQELATLATAERACRWSLGDTILSAIRAAANKKARTGIFKAAASILHCSHQTTRVMATVAATFPTAHRHADVPFSVYRAVAQVSARLQRDPLVMLDEVLAGDLGVLAVLRLGETSPRYTLKADCPECGIHWSVTSTFKTGEIPCGYCIARMKADKVVGEWPVLGSVG